MVEPLLSDENGQLIYAKRNEAGEITEAHALELKDPVPQMDAASTEITFKVEKYESPNVNELATKLLEKFKVQHNKEVTCDTKK